MKRIEYQLRRCIFNGVAYTPKFVEYPTVSDINKLSAMPLELSNERSYIIEIL